MRKLAAPLLVTLGLSACSSAGFHDASQRTEALAAFRSGRASLACGNGLDCALKWQSARGSAERFAQMEQWENLAETVLATGYDSDLSWFYLGLAAQGLRDDRAARTYYETSMRRTTAAGFASCHSEALDLCGPVSLPSDAERMMAELGTERAGSSAGRPRPAKAVRAAAKTTPASPPDTAWQTPAASQPSSAWVDPKSTSSAGAGGASGWVAPAPVQ